MTFGIHGSTLSIMKKVQYMHFTTCVNVIKEHNRLCLFLTITALTKANFFYGWGTSETKTRLRFRTRVFTLYWKMIYRKVGGGGGQGQYEEKTFYGDFQPLCKWEEKFSWLWGHEQTICPLINYEIGRGREEELSSTAWTAKRCVELLQKPFWCFVVWVYSCGTLLAL